MLLRLLPIYAGIVAIPFLIESYTFYLYTIREPAFFTFSGSRWWVFLATALALGFLLGRASRRSPLTIVAGGAAIAIAVLVALLYQFCDERQCYYAGPDGLGWLRLGVILFAVASVGIMVGNRSKAGAPAKSRVDAVFFGAIAAIFLGYYPSALLLDTFLPNPLDLAILAFASTAPFFFAGAASAMFSERKALAALSAVLGWAVLPALFGLALESAIMLAAAIPAALLGHRLAGRRLASQKAAAALLSALIILFSAVAVHPFVDAPMNLSAFSETGRPTHYTGVYHDEQYFPTKRVEVTIDLGQLDASRIEREDFLLAGIGAQSPNCCKDGLDYGYRADILVTATGLALVARAWETCDQNAACSAYPWISTMHQFVSELRGANNYYPSLMLAMEWDKDGIVQWQYKAGSGEWSTFSSFDPPEIENPYFNLGVIWVGNPFTNPVTNNANFYQAGVSTSGQAAPDYGQITFECLSYYDKQGEKHCVPALARVPEGNSHWKVLWKWGVPHQNVSTVIDGQNATIIFGK